MEYQVCKRMDIVSLYRLDTHWHIDRGGMID